MPIAGPMPRDEFGGDLSPFGVRGMAGGLREMTRSTHGSNPREFVIRGGSFMRTRREELWVTARSGLPNVALPDVGFRLVKRLAPPWFARRGEPLPFHESFDGGALDDRWHRCIGSLAAPLPAVAGEGALVAGGWLRCRGGIGDDSRHTEVGRRVAFPASDWRVSAVVRVTRRLEKRGSASITVASDLIPGRHRLMAVRLDPASRSVALSATGVAPEHRDVGFASGEDWRVELRLSGERRLEARAWPRGAARPHAPSCELELPAGFGAGRFLVFHADNLAGVGLAVDHVSVEALP